MGEGQHPVPSRTRQLSPPPPMVLPGRPGGRVGRRRELFPALGREPRSHAVITAWLRRDGRDMGWFVEFEPISPGSWAGMGILRACSSRRSRRPLDVPSLERMQQADGRTSLPRVEAGARQGSPAEEVEARRRTDQLPPVQAGRARVRRVGRGPGPTVRSPRSFLRPAGPGSSARGVLRSGLRAPSDRRRDWAATRDPSPASAPRQARGPGPRVPGWACDRRVRAPGRAHVPIRARARERLHARGDHRLPG